MPRQCQSANTLNARQITVSIGEHFSIKVDIVPNQILAVFWQLKISMRRLVYHIVVKNPCDGLATQSNFFVWVKALLKGVVGL